MGRAFILAFPFGFCAALALIAAVFATGSTFGQRCARVYPHDPRRQELCAAQLEGGNTSTAFNQ